MEHQPTESQTMMFCHGCAKPLHVSAVACPSCGAPQRKRAESTVSESEKSKVTAGVLALLLGGLGIHKFYTGAWGWGIVYIVLCWTYVPALVALGEGIRYLVLSKEEFARKAAVMKGPFAWLW
jgi:TM2 domain-containing membrane protein YozV